MSKPLKARAFRNRIVEFIKYFPRIGLLAFLPAIALVSLSVRGLSPSLHELAELLVSEYQKYSNDFISEIVRRTIVFFSAFGLKINFVPPEGWADVFLLMSMKVFSDLKVQKQKATRIGVKARWFYLVWGTTISLVFSALAADLVKVESGLRPFILVLLGLMIYEFGKNIWDGIMHVPKHLLNEPSGMVQNLRYHFSSFLLPQILLGVLSYSVTLAYQSANYPAPSLFGVIIFLLLTTIQHYFLAVRDRVRDKESGRPTSVLYETTKWKWASNVLSILILAFLLLLWGTI